MTKRFALALVACVAIAMLVLPASAALNKIPAGGTVFMAKTSSMLQPVRVGESDHCCLV